MGGRTGGARVTLARAASLTAFGRSVDATRAGGATSDTNPLQYAPQYAPQCAPHAVMQHGEWLRWQGKSDPPMFIDTAQCAAWLARIGAWMPVARTGAERCSHADAPCTPDKASRSATTMHAPKLRQSFITSAKRICAITRETRDAKTGKGIARS
jgi:hypothetical protein